ncbi:tripartite motif-containing protein 12A-like [Megalobrama amblycephala]|uniref:tripartite motif-containing protein 12A-like n=1 Tax=Megalobrama amblycephala TaxID=75352 RepID=UPI0020147EBF|nr:tripartite motif-containing protein 12A-like [Megalobrama amblycephala]
MASQSFAEEDLSCPVCCDIYINPVLLPCSHSVCSSCIQKVWENKTLKECPVCRTTSSNDRPPLNLALKNLCESFQKERRQRSSSEDETVCSFHKEKLKLFCLDDQQLVCLVCRDSRKHSNHRFCPIDEAAMDNKEILSTSLERLQEELRISVNHEQNLCKSAEDIKFQAHLTVTQIKQEFEELHQFLRNEEVLRITALRKEEEQRNQMMEEKMQEMTKQISSLTNIIRDIEQQMKAEDVSFLQNFKATLQRAQYSLPDPDPSPSVTITFTDHLTNLKLNVLQKMQDNVGETSDLTNDWGAWPEKDSQQVKEKKTRTLTNDWGAWPGNDWQKVKEKKTKTLTNDWGAWPGNYCQKVKENKTKTLTNDWGAWPGNYWQKVKENKTKTLTNDWGAWPGNDWQKVKEKKTRKVTNDWGAWPAKDSQQVKENEMKTVTNDWESWSYKRFPTSKRK